MSFLLALETLGAAPRLDSVADARSAGANWVVVGKRGEKFFAYANGKEWGPFDFAKVLGVGESLWAFAGFKGREAKAFVNGEEFGPFLDLCCAFEAGSTWLLLGKAPDGKVMLVGGRRYGPYSGLWGPVVDGEHWAFWFNEGRAKAVLVDGRRYGPYNEISPPRFVRGEVLFTAILEGDYFIIWGDTALGPYEGVMALEDYEDGWAACVWDKRGFWALADGRVRGPFAYCRLERGLFTAVEREKKHKVVRFSRKEL